MRAALRSVFRVNRANLGGSFAIVLLAAAMLTATGSWVQAGWGADGSDSALALLSILAASFAGTTVIIVVFLVAATFAAALRHRRREFALLRSIGATAAQVRAMITGEVMIVVLTAAPLGAAAGVLLAPRLTALLVAVGMVPAGYDLAFSPLSVGVTLVIVLLTGLVAARLSARESARLSPTLAVQQSAVEPPAISRGRRGAALITAVAGLAVAVTPVFFPGQLGAASGASSALLLVIAASLAGPVILGAVATRTVAAARRWAPAPLVLAALNARGFSRRNTAVVLPLALLLCLGAVQSGAGVALTVATGTQVEKALAAELVATGTPADLRALSRMPGVTAVAQTAVVPAAVRVDDPDEDGFGLLDGFSWEPSPVRIIAPADSGLWNPGVIRGSLADLVAEDTIAVSEESLLFTGKGLGDTLGLRWRGGEETTVTIVAVYDNALGAGDYLVSPALTAFDAASTTVLVGTEPGQQSAVADALAAEGATVTDARTYAQSVRVASGAEQTLSNTLLLALLAFIAIAAVQTLATTTFARRGEFDLLRRTGATRGQLAAMIAIEALFVALAALLLGAAAALPALLGVGLGLAGSLVAAIDPLVFGGLAVVVVVLPIATMIAVGWRAMTPSSRRITLAPTVMPR